jgi:hypothetical protein
VVFRRRGSGLFCFGAEQAVHGSAADVQLVGDVGFADAGTVESPDLFVF